MRTGVSFLCEGNKPIASRVLKSTTCSKTTYIPGPLQCLVILSVDVQKR